MVKKYDDDDDGDKDDDHDDDEDDDEDELTLFDGECREKNWQC